MKLFYLNIILFFLSTSITYGQYPIGNDGGTPKWISLGSIALAQGGNDCFIRIVGGGGYNANKGQQGNVEMHMRTSNWSSVDVNGYGFSAVAVSNGQGQFAAQFRIVPNNSGGAATAYTIYAYFASWPGGTYYTVESLNGVWTSISSNSTTDPGGYVVPFEYFVNNDTFIAGNVGVGTSDTHGYKFAVNGDVHAKKVVIDLINWPDYVFKPTYNLKSLSEVKTYIDLNHHLPEMPSEKEVAEKGLDLGEMNKLLTKKVEELTLYLIEKDKEMKQQQEELKQLQEQVKQLIKAGSKN